MPERLFLGLFIAYHIHVMASGESQDFIPTPPNEPEAQLGYVDRLVERFDHVRLKATYENLRGDRMDVEHTIEIREWWNTLIKASNLRTHDWPAETVSELERIGKSLNKLVGEAEKYRRRQEGSPGWWKWERRIRRLPNRLQPSVRRADRAAGLVL